jgi:BirA family biotin operon repressor/biotin-[acetyl-CoA-carboxylase] ligase
LSFFLPNENFKIKWPNDIYVNNKKIAGILIENVWQGKNLMKTVIGIGLNVNQTEFSNLGAISMRNLSEIFIEKEIILQKYCEYFEYFFKLLQQGFAKFLRNEYQNLLFAKNEVRLFQIFGETLQAKILSVFPDGKISIEIVSENKVISLNINELNFIL